jgi:hypothetical protein
MAPSSSHSSDHAIHGILGEGGSMLRLKEFRRRPSRSGSHNTAARHSNTISSKIPITDFDTLAPAVLF